MGDRTDRVAQFERLVYFHRNYHGFTGGHLKVSDYFTHVDTAKGYRAEIFFLPNRSGPSTIRGYTLVTGFFWNGTHSRRISCFSPVSTGLALAKPNATISHGRSSI